METEVGTSGRGGGTGQSVGGVAPGVVVKVTETVKTTERNLVIDIITFATGLLAATVIYFSQRG